MSEKNKQSKDQKKILKDVIVNEVKPLMIGLRNEMKDANKSLVGLLSKQIAQSKIYIDASGKEIVTIKGDDGHTPEKGVEYFTDADVAEFLEKVTPVKGVTYFTEAERKQFVKDATPKKGVHYFTAEDIKAIILKATPTKGKHYFTKKEIADFIKEITPKKGVHYRDGVDGVTKTIIKKDETRISAERVRELLESLTGAGRLKISAIKDLEERLQQIAASVGGGGIGGSGGGGTGGGGTGGAVASVNGQIGVVTLTTAEISEGSNLYFTNERAQDAVGAMITDGSLEYIDATPSLRINLAHSNTFTTNQGIAFTSLDAADITAFEVGFTRTVAQVNDDYGFSAFYAYIDDSSDISGEIEDAVLSKTGFEVAVFRSGTSTVNWIDGFETFRGYSSYVAYATGITGAKHDIELIGHDMTVYHSSPFSNDGFHTHSLFGNKIAVNSSSTVTIDCFVTRKAYGEYIDVSISNDGDVNEAYGIYIKNVYSNDVAYAIYSETTAISHFEGDIEVPDEAYDATAWNGSLEVPTKNAIRDKIESMGSGGGWVTAPAAPNSTGTAGDKAYDSSYLYICVATNTWKRIAYDATWIAGDFMLMQNGDRKVFQNGDGTKLQSSI